jgi:hypothetical protein
MTRLLATTANVSVSPSTAAAITAQPLLASIHTQLLAQPSANMVSLRGQPIAAHALGGVAIGNFSGDTSGFSPASLGLYPDSTTYAIDGSIIGEVNVTPNLSLRLAGDYYGTGFGSSFQSSPGFTYGFVYRLGKQ